MIIFSLVPTILPGLKPLHREVTNLNSQEALVPHSKGVFRTEPAIHYLELFTAEGKAI